MSHKSEYFQDDRQPDPESEAQTMNKTWICQVCRSTVADGALVPPDVVRCHEFSLRDVFRPQTVLLGLWGPDVLLMCSTTENERNILLSKEEALALADRLNRYAERLP